MLVGTYMIGQGVPPPRPQPAPLPPKVKPKETKTETKTETETETPYKSIKDLNLKALKSITSLDLSVKNLNGYNRGKLTEAQRMDLNKEKIRPLTAKDWEIIVKHKWLQKLVLEGRNVQSIPKSIKKLKHLEILDLSDCNIKVFPKSISKLKKLKVLYLNYNFLEAIPQELYKLKNLEYLDIYFNNFKSETIYQVKKSLPNTTVNYNY